MSCRLHVVRDHRVRLALVACVVALTTACQLEVQVGVDVRPDGSGEVTVAGALDEAAAARVPDLADQLEVDDLVAAGWTITGPLLEGDGRTWVRASKPFSSPAQAGPILDEISGEGGAFRDFEVRRSPTLLRDRWELTGTVDLTRGLASFSDEALRARLDGTDVGMTEEEVVAEAGRPLAEAFTFEVDVALPGDVTSNAPGPSGSGATWQPVLGQQLALAATGTRLQAVTLAWFAVALGALVALVVLLVRRRRHRPL